MSWYKILTYWDVNSLRHWPNKCRWSQKRRRPKNIKMTPKMRTTSLMKTTPKRKMTRPICKLKFVHSGPVEKKIEGFIYPGFYLSEIDIFDKFCQFSTKFLIWKKSQGKSLTQLNCWIWAIHMVKHSPGTTFHC